MRRLFGDGGHLFRVFGLFGAGILVFLGLQRLLVPEGFGLYGHYRAGALEDNRVRPVVYAGRAACADCHDDAVTFKAAGPHARIGCESCHGPLAAHASDPERAKPVPPQSEPLCLRCHGQNVGRPAGFPQIDRDEHVPDGTCTDCHTSHNPALAPGEQP